MPLKYAQLGTGNERRKPHTIAVEPWADEYTLSSGEELTLIVFDDTKQPFFAIWEWEETTQVYCENFMDYYVIREGRRYENRTDRGPSVSIEQDIQEMFGSRFSVGASE